MIAAVLAAVGMTLVGGSTSWQLGACSPAGDCVVFGRPIPTQELCIAMRDALIGEGIRGAVCTAVRPKP